MSPGLLVLPSHGTANSCGSDTVPGCVSHHGQPPSLSCPPQSHLPYQPRDEQQPQETAPSAPARGAAANGSLEPGAVS